LLFLPILRVRTSYLAAVAFVNAVQLQLTPHNECMEQAVVDLYLPYHSNTDTGKYICIIDLKPDVSKHSFIFVPASLLGRVAGASSPRRTRNTPRSTAVSESSPRYTPRRDQARSQM